MNINLHISHYIKIQAVMLQGTVSTRRPYVLREEFNHDQTNTTRPRASTCRLHRDRVFVHTRQWRPPADSILGYVSHSYPPSVDVDVFVHGHGRGHGRGRPDQDS